MEKQAATTEERFKRLRYRSWHRGCKETDLILGNFSETQLEGLDPELLIIYEQLLDENDADIWNWLIGKDVPEDSPYAPLLAMMQTPVLLD